MSGLDKIIDRVSSKVKGLDLSGIKLDMPNGTPPIPEDKVQGSHRKAVILLAQREQANTWHVIKILRKPAVHGLVFYWDKKLYVMDTGKVWYYDERSNPVIMYDVGRMIPVKRDMDGTLVVTPAEPIKPDATDNFVKAENIDSGFAYTMLVKRLLEQLARASAPEAKTMDMMTILMLVVGIIAGVAIGLFAAAPLLHLVPANTAQIVTVTQTATVFHSTNSTLSISGFPTQSINNTTTHIITVGPNG